MAPQDRPDLTNPEVLDQIFTEFGQQMASLMEGQQRLIQMTNYLSGESLALTAILTALRKKSGVTVTHEEAMAAVGPLLRPEAKPQEDAIRTYVSDEINRLLTEL